MKYSHCHLVKLFTLNLYDGNSVSLRLGNDYYKRALNVVLLYKKLVDASA